MATIAISGLSGTITGIAGISTAEITKWEMNISRQTLKATSMASVGWDEVIGGLKSAKGTIDYIGPYVDVIPDTLQAGVAFVTKSGHATFTCSVLLSEVKITTPVDDLVKYSCNYEVSGAVTVS